ncbi:unnamed protein product [Hydatigera taeniaeformis]|uniref:NR LBD domain-containing protein n=1 Tax=Hydatigena taeniaeformis TaxID=6205 RepID=A0A0R3WQ76_HYDTA|nr:unnamed protein product [Hydatigera taeniaeformis]
MFLVLKRLSSVVVLDEDKRLAKRRLIEANRARKQAEAAMAAPQQPPPTQPLPQSRSNLMPNTFSPTTSYLPHKPEPITPPDFLLSSPSSSANNSNLYWNSAGVPHNLPQQQFPSPPPSTAMAQYQQPQQQPQSEANFHILEQVSQSVTLEKTAFMAAIAAIKVPTSTSVSPQKCDTPTNTTITATTATSPSTTLEAKVRNTSAAMTAPLMESEAPTKAAAIAVSSSDEVPLPAPGSDSSAASETSSDSTDSGNEVECIQIKQSSFDEILKSLTDAYKTMPISSVKIEETVKTISENADANQSEKMNTLLNMVSNVIKLRVMDTLSFAKFIPGFLLLSVRDQTQLLQSSLLDILILRAADALARTMARAAAMGGDGGAKNINLLATACRGYAFISTSTDKHSTAIRNIARHIFINKVDATELALVAGILLTSDRSCIKHCGPVTAIKTVLSNMLASYVMKDGSEGVKLRKVFSMFTKIHKVSIHNKEGFMKHLYFDTDVIENKYLSEILVAQCEDEECQDVATSSASSKRVPKT